MVEVEVFRYCPGRDSKPFWEKFNLPVEKGETVLGVLQYIRSSIDDSLAFKSYCTNEHCGECGVRLNGRPVLACHAQITTDRVVLKPLDRFTVVKDLVVDLDDISRRLWTALPPLAGTGRSKDILNEEEYDTFFMAGKCNTCLLCQSTCPLFRVDDQLTAGPAFYVAAAQCLLRARTWAGFNDLLARAIRHDMLKCTLCGNCSGCCPQAVDPVKVIMTILDLMLKKSKIPLDRESPIFKVFNRKGFGRKLT